MNLPIQKYGKTERRKFGNINEVIDIPDLVEIQKDSYRKFIEEGIGEVFEDFSPITDYSDHFELYFLDHEFGTKPKYDEKECRNRDATYALPLRVKVRLVNKVKEEVIDQEVFMGDFPLMTENGSFIINGAERVIVSQLVRSPGAYNESEKGQDGPRNVQDHRHPQPRRLARIRAGFAGRDVGTRRPQAQDLRDRPSARPRLRLGRRHPRHVRRRRAHDQRHHRKGYRQERAGRPHRAVPPPAPRRSADGRFRAPAPAQPLFRSPPLRRGQGRPL